MMIRIPRFLLAAMTVAATAAGATASTPSLPEGHNLTPVEFQQRIATDSTAVVLDVRTPEEYAQGHLPGAINVNYYDQPAFTAACEDFNPANNYYVYCRSGRRSAEACNEMMTYGLPVYNMCGGILDWQKQNLPLTKK